MSQNIPTTDILFFTACRISFINLCENFLFEKFPRKTCSSDIQLVLYVGMIFHILPVLETSKTLKSLIVIIGHFNRVNN
jgi:hypothetical protein